jgi:hypothetical protein
VDLTGQLLNPPQALRQLLESGSVDWIRWIRATGTVVAPPGASKKVRESNTHPNNASITRRLAS